MPISSPKPKHEKIMIGCYEWCKLPGLEIPAIKAKIDTGAKTSSIHAFNISAYQEQDKSFVQFEIHPLQNNHRLSISCTAEVIDRRSVMSSSGHKELRYVIETPLTLGATTWNIELTLANRDQMQFRMLLGRQALSGHTLIDPQLTHRLGRISKKTLPSLYPDLQG